MATEERLPPACAFALSVLAERDLDPEAVPEEAVEAAQQHMATCPRCVNASANPSSSTTGAAPRKKKKVRRVAEASDYYTGAGQSAAPLLLDAAPPSATEQEPEGRIPSSAPAEASSLAVGPAIASSATTGIIDCQQCREMLPEYAEAMDSGQKVALLYPEVQEHLLTCESGCLVLLEMFRQEAKATRKYRRRPVRDPFSAMGWALSGFFRGGQVPMHPMALSYGVLILILIFASLSTYAGIKWHDAIYHPVPHLHLIPTPDGIGFSDGLKIYDACNAGSYHDKRQAIQALQKGQLAQADKLLTSAMNAVQTDTTGCNGAEAAIYREDLHVRQSGRPYGVVVVSFDSGPGNADPQGGTDRHILYAAYTQELVGAFIAQQQYNTTQMQTPGAPLLYLVLANTTGTESGALQIANTIPSMVRASDLHAFGLLASGAHPLLAVLGLGPSSLVQVVLPVMCRAGVPLIVPTATGLFIIDLLTQTSLYRHCTPGFAFIRFSPDDASQSALAANYAYTKLHVHNAAIFYDPSNPSSSDSAQSFKASFLKYKRTHIVAQETAVASGLLDANGRPQASRADLLAGLNDALQAKSHPDLIFAPLLTNDVITLGQAIARLPQKQQPILMIGGEFVQPSALQSLAQWARQQQLSLPRVFVSLSSAARPPSDEGWQKQFYASFCTSFATPGSFCSGAAALDQGALFFGDGIEIVARAVGPISDASAFPTASQMVQRISAEQFAGVSCPIALRLHDNVLVTSTKVLPVILAVQQDGSIQIVG
ncbi:MAG TPA: hypothetical protein VKV37_00090 [Ktedonobacteraceae bacterium]|nr:hypothetical protein [Ktedonobacteraceae bacterium]